MEIAAGNTAAHGNARIYVAFTSMPQNTHIHMPASVFTVPAVPLREVMNGCVPVAVLLLVPSEEDPSEEGLSEEYPSEEDIT